MVSEQSNEHRLLCRCFWSVFDQHESIAPKLEELVKVVGTVSSPVQNIVFSGITFENTTWLAPTTDGYMWGSYSSFPSYTDASGNKQPGWTTAVHIVHYQPF